MSPKVSIIVPVYNAENYLKDCVHSIMAQTFSDFELILIDDCSPDGSGDLCDQFEDERIKVIHLEVNSGAAVARNIGMEAASGEYLLCVDPDDTIAPETIQENLEIAERDGTDMVIFGYTKVLDIEGSPQVRQDVTYPSCILTGKQQINAALPDLKRLVIIDSPCNKLYRFAVIKDNHVRMPAGEIFEDTEFNLQLLYFLNSISINSKCYYDYMQRDISSSTTKSYNPQKMVLLKKRSKTLTDYFKAQGCYTEENERVCNYLYLKYIFSCFIDLHLPATRLCRAERLRYIQSEIETDEFQSASTNAQGFGKIDRIVIALARTNNKRLIDLFSGAMYFVKFRMQKIFIKLKR